MNATATLCSCPRSHSPTDEDETPCGEPFTRQDEQGNWFWCLYCDAHWTDCENKGSADYAQCPDDPPPPCRIVE